MAAIAVKAAEWYVERLQKDWWVEESDGDDESWTIGLPEASWLSVIQDFWIIERYGAWVLQSEWRPGIQVSIAGCYVDSTSSWGNKGEGHGGA